MGACQREEDEGEESQGEGCQREESQGEVLPQTNLKEREVSDIELGTRAKIPWSPSPNVKEKNMKRDKAFHTFKIRREEWVKAKAEHKAKRDKKRKAEKKEKEIK